MRCSRGRVSHRTAAAHAGLGGRGRCEVLRVGALSVPAGAWWCAGGVDRLPWVGVCRGDDAPGDGLSAGMMVALCRWASRGMSRRPRCRAGLPRARQSCARDGQWVARGASQWGGALRSEWDSDVCRRSPSPKEAGVSVYVCRQKRGTPHGWRLAREGQAAGKKSRGPLAVRCEPPASLLGTPWYGGRPRTRMGHAHQPRGAGSDGEHRVPTWKGPVRRRECVRWRHGSLDPFVSESRLALGRGHRA